MWLPEPKYNEVKNTVAHLQIHLVSLLHHHPGLGHLGCMSRDSRVVKIDPLTSAGVCQMPFVGLARETPNFF